MWSRSVRASHLERTCVLPGDELIPEPTGTLTHAITIRRPAREVWPWLAQMGAGNRAEWYSYCAVRLWSAHHRTACDRGGAYMSCSICRARSMVAVDAS